MRRHRTLHRIRASSPSDPLVRVMDPRGVTRLDVAGKSQGVAARSLLFESVMASREPPNSLAPRGLRDLLRELYPGSRLVEATALRADSAGAGPDDRTAKAAGYGRPVMLRMVDASGARFDLVWRTAAPDHFGHDRRSDRAQELLLAFDSFNRMPDHVGAVDVGAILADQKLASLRQGGEFYLLTHYAPGQLYAGDLRRIAAERVARDLDLERCDALVRYLVDLHAAPGDGPAAYRRAVRDLIGHGEGIFGVVDSYAADVPSAPPERLAAIEHRCLDWRWRLRDREARVRRTHGDFHPFNLLFADGTRLTVLDASRGCQGDPADDIAALAINYLFFALERPQAWPDGLGPLWRRFWSGYLDASGDRDLCRVVAPFLTWRGLVLASPAFYPAMSPEARDRLLGFVERSLDRDAFDPAAAEKLFR
jgi:Phosphotransferase enzyme family